MIQQPNQPQQLEEKSSLFSSALKMGGTFLTYGIISGIGGGISRRLSTAIGQRTVGFLKKTVDKDLAQRTELFGPSTWRKTAGPIERVVAGSSASRLGIGDIIGRFGRMNEADATSVLKSINIRYDKLAPDSFLQKSMRGIRELSKTIMDESDVFRQISGVDWKSDTPYQDAKNFLSSVAKNPRAIRGFLHHNLREYMNTLPGFYAADRVLNPEEHQRHGLVGDFARFALIGTIYDRAPMAMGFAGRLARAGLMEKTNIWSAAHQSIFPRAINQFESLAMGVGKYVHSIASGQKKFNEVFKSQIHEKQAPLLAGWHPLKAFGMAANDAATEYTKAKIGGPMEHLSQLDRWHKVYGKTVAGVIHAATELGGESLGTMGADDKAQLFAAHVQMRKANVFNKKPFLQRWFAYQPKTFDYDQDALAVKQAVARALHKDPSEFDFLNRGLELLKDTPTGIYKGNGAEFNPFRFSSEYLKRKTFAFADTNAVTKMAGGIFNLKSFISPAGITRIDDEVFSPQYTQGKLKYGRPPIKPGDSAKPASRVFITGGGRKGAVFYKRELDMNFAELRETELKRTPAGKTPKPLLGEYAGKSMDEHWNESWQNVWLPESGPNAGVFDNIYNQKITGPLSMASNFTRMLVADLVADVEHSASEREFLSAISTTTIYNTAGDDSLAKVFLRYKNIHNGDIPNEMIEKVDLDQVLLNYNVGQGLPTAQRGIGLYDTIMKGGPGVRALDRIKARTLHFMHKWDLGPFSGESSILKNITQYFSKVSDPYSPRNVFQRERAAGGALYRFAREAPEAFSEIGGGATSDQYQRYIAPIIDISERGYNTITKLIQVNNKFRDTLFKTLTHTGGANGFYNKNGTMRAFAVKEGDEEVFKFMAKQAEGAREVTMEEVFHNSNSLMKLASLYQSEGDIENKAVRIIGSDLERMIAEFRTNPESINSTLQRTLKGEDLRRADIIFEDMLRRSIYNKTANVFSLDNAVRDTANVLLKDGTISKYEHNSVVFRQIFQDIMQNEYRSPSGLKTAGHLDSFYKLFDANYAKNLSEGAAAIKSGTEPETIDILRQIMDDTFSEFNYFKGGITAPVWAPKSIRFRADLTTPTGRYWQPIEDSDVAGVWAAFMGNRLNKVLSYTGMGISAANTTTLGSYVSQYFRKRLFPAAGLYMGYKAIDALTKTVAGSTISVRDIQSLIETIPVIGPVADKALDMLSPITDVFKGAQVGFTQTAELAGINASSLPLVGPVMKRFSSGALQPVYDLIAGARIGMSHVLDITGVTSIASYLEGLMPGSINSPLSRGLRIIGGPAIGGMIGRKLGMAGKAFGLTTERATQAGMLIGGVAGLAAGMMDLTMSSDQINSIYGGEEQVPVRKGRWWMLSRESWEGGRIQYFAPNWYSRYKSGYSNSFTKYGSPIEQLLYGDIPGFGFNPIGMILDPYHYEKKHYYSRPYPETGQTFSDVPLFGGIMSNTIGHVMKPSIRMHERDMVSFGGGQVAFGSTGLVQGGHDYNVAAIQSSLSMGMHYTKNQLVDLAGLYGFAVDNMLGTPQIQRAEASLNWAYSPYRAYWDMQLGDPFGVTEPIRRLIPNKRQGNVEWINNIPNTMPDWMPGRMSKGIDLRHGDPYTAGLAEGEIRLPGSAFESLYDVQHTFPIDTSKVNSSDWKSIVQSLLGTAPRYPDEEIEDTEAGQMAKQYIQAMFNANANVSAMNKIVYDPNRDISGQVDIIAGEDKNKSIVMIKPMTSKMFGSIGSPLRRHVDEIIANMGITGLKSPGEIYYVDTENPENYASFTVQFDEERHSQILKNVSKARDIAADRLKGGAIPTSYGASYSHLDRLRILANISPWSDEYKREEQMVLSQQKSGNLSAGQSAQVKKIQRQAEAIRRQMDFYPRRFSQSWDEFLTPTAITNQFGEKLDDYSDWQMMLNSNPHYKPATEYSLPARSVGAAWEFAQRMVPFRGKIMPYFTPIEAYEAYSLYGSKFTPWDSPYESFIAPKVREGLGGRGPLDSAQAFGTVGAVAMGPFGATIGGILGGMYGGIKRGAGLTNRSYIPRNVEDEREIDAYFDAIEYEKNKRLYQSTGLDIFRDNMTRTMMGMENTIAGVAKAAPQREKPFISAFAQVVDPDERERILSAVEPRIGRALEDLWGSRPRQYPTRIVHEVKNMPSDQWVGWASNSEIDDYKVKVYKEEGLNAHNAGLGWVDQLNRIEDRKIETIPYKEEIDRRKYSYISSTEQITKALQEIGRRLGVDVKSVSSMGSIGDGTVSVNLNIEYDRTQDLQDMVYRTTR